MIPMKRLAPFRLTLLTLAFGLTLALGAAAQTQLTPQTFATGGARGVGTTVVLTYTIGQPFAASLANVGATLLLTQGFQQPLLNGPASRPAPAVTSGRQPTTLEVSVYPNPTPDRLHVQFTAGATELPATLTATFTDAAGRTVLRQPFSPSAGLTTLDLGALPEGTYLLLVQDGAGHQLSAHRVARVQ